MEDSDTETIEERDTCQVQLGVMTIHSHSQIELLLSTMSDDNGHMERLRLTHGTRSGSGCGCRGVGRG